MKVLVTPSTAPPHEEQTDTEGWTLGPGGQTARPGRGQRPGTVWALRLNREEEPADAVDPEHRQEVPMCSEKRPLNLLLLPMKNLDPLVLRAPGNDWTCFLGDRKPVRFQTRLNRSEVVLTSRNWSEPVLTSLNRSEVV
ncbi:hypothetical protein EYF80_020201 [Liparis tanakae]|uniref:Uncharacterized protein n=1 Tax=Liparis tanakae TaxID=230148 RepID=A0A4Z2HUM2_9TELE|nr:hypothetical protein EYF80_020201 [Liparis tanakae]